MGLERERQAAAGHVDDRLLAILSASQKMNSERDREALLDLIAQEATRLMDADRASIFLLDRQTNELWSKVALGSDEVLRFDARLGIAGAVVKTGETINVADVQTDPRFYAIIVAVLFGVRLYYARIRAPLTGTSKLELRTQKD